MHGGAFGSSRSRWWADKRFRIVGMCVYSMHFALQCLHLHLHMFLFLEEYWFMCYINLYACRLCSWCYSSSSSSSPVLESVLVSRLLGMLMCSIWNRMGMAFYVASMGTPINCTQRHDVDGRLQHSLHGVLRIGLSSACTEYAPHSKLRQISEVEPAGRGIVNSGWPHPTFATCT